MTWITRQRSRLGSLASIREGAGPTVTLLHGVGLNADAWGGQIDALASHYSVIAFDMAGHGDSPQFNWNAPNLTDFVDAARNDLDGPTVVIGHSMGAMIALELAQDPNVLGVVALNAIYQRSKTAHAAVHARAKQLQDDAQIDPLPTLKRWFDDLSSSEAIACAQWLRAASIEGYRAAYSVFANENGPTQAELLGLAKPALFMTGGLESNSTPDMSIKMGKLCPMGQAHVINDAAHMMPMTHAPEVNKKLLKFISQCYEREL